MHIGTIGRTLLLKARCRNKDILTSIISSWVLINKHHKQSRPSYLTKDGKKLLLCVKVHPMYFLAVKKNIPDLLIKINNNLTSRISKIKLFPSMDMIVR